MLILHDEFDISEHDSHSQLNHSHSHSHTHNDKNSANEHEGDGGHEHQHAHFGSTNYLQVVAAEDIKNETEFIILSIVFYYESLTFSHHPSEVLRPPITTII